MDIRIYGYTDIWIYGYTDMDICNGWNGKKGTGSLHELIPFFEERERNVAPFFEKER